MFDEAALEDGLRGYEREAIDAYPEQAERIGIAVAAIRDFLNSDHAAKMIMKGTPEGPAAFPDEPPVPGPAGAVSPR